MVCGAIEGEEPLQQVVAVGQIGHGGIFHPDGLFLRSAGIIYAHIAQARIEASVDALTGVKNRHAFLTAQERLNLKIREKRAPEFALVILDVNNLKRVNDTIGHSAGDQLIRDACNIICTTFSHSPVFRVGGDEFAVISQGSDYERIDELVQRIHEHNMESLRSGGVIVACGMAKYEGEDSVAQVFEHADVKMYENKSMLKAKKRAGG